jgi:hypothetical protein
MTLNDMKLSHAQNPVMYLNIFIPGALDFVTGLSTFPHSPVWNILSLLFFAFCCTPYSFPLLLFPFLSFFLFFHFLLPK